MAIILIYIQFSINTNNKASLNTNKIVLLVFDFN